ncbi:hypothetical protein EVAR_23815_1 [Eumeta japonica]|uniref:Uncharacterized protein n=1 Tax=Eumeta variegata TaxID=151549 RepID=A0A4C1VNK7_EUMVA|nr:hypothetical protein EVAR_23815_1 [Eumeta japonica]
MSGIEFESGMESRIENGVRIRIENKTGTEIENGTKVENECGIKSLTKIGIKNDIRIAIDIDRYVIFVYVEVELSLFTLERSSAGGSAPTPTLARFAYHFVFVDGSDTVIRKYFNINACQEYSNYQQMRPPTTFQDIAYAMHFVIYKGRRQASSSSVHRQTYMLVNYTSKQSGDEARPAGDASRAESRPAVVGFMPFLRLFVNFIGDRGVFSTPCRYAGRNDCL